MPLRLRRLTKAFFCLLSPCAAAFLNACSLRNSGSTTPAPVTYTVSANVTGLTGTGLVLQMNGSYTTPVAANGVITFPAPIASGTAYTVTVSSSPSTPNQICTVTNGAGTIASNVTNVAVACAFDLTTVPTKTLVDSGVPAAASARIASIVTAADIQPLGTPVLIPQSSAATRTPLFAEDSNQNLFLAALSNASTTTFSVDSTAVTLVSLTMGVGGVQGDLASDAFQTTVRAVSSYAALTADITSALAAGTSPLNSSTVVADLTAVSAQVVQANLAVALTNKANKTLANSNATAGIPQLPFQLAGPFTTLPTLESVYIKGLSQVSGTDGIDVINAMGIEFNATTADVASSQTLQPNTTLTGSSFLLTQLSSLLPTLTPTHLQTEEGTYRVTLNQSSQTRLDNSKLIVADVISSAVALAGFQSSLWKTCANEQAAAFLLSLGDTAQQALLATPDGTAAITTLSGAMTVNVYLQLAQSTYKCAAKDTLSLSLTAFSRFLGPIKAIWDLTSTTWTIGQAVTDAAQAKIYWNQTITHQLCEKNGAFTNCGARHDLYFLPFDYLLVGNQLTTNHLTFSVNGVQIASYQITQGSGAPNSFKICNVPGGTYFNIDYTTQNINPGPDTGMWGIYAENATVAGADTYGYYFQQAHIPLLASGTFAVQADNCADTGTCTTTPAFTSTVSNACVVIPGLNN